MGRFWKSRGVGGGHMKNPFRGWGMDIFWNHTFRLETFYTWNKVSKMSKGNAMTRGWEMFNT